MLIRNHHILVFLMYSLASVGIAIDTDYGPFPPNRRPKPFTMQTCVEWKHAEAKTNGESSEWILGTPDDTAKKGVHIRVMESPSRELTLEVRGGDGKSVVGSRVVSDASYFRSSTGDLNADGKPDFMVDTSYYGCGLACWNQTLVFAVSKNDTYDVSSIFTMFRGDCDLVDLDRDGRCELIHTVVLWSDKRDERDGKSHAYWVFHKLELEGSRWKISKADGDFPKWVWYTFKPNQKATRRLSEEAKARIWREQGGDEQIFWKPLKK